MNSDILNTRFLVFDLEMTGLSPVEDSIIEIGAIPLTGLSVDGDYFFTAVKPYTNVRAESKQVHGMDGNDLWKAPPAEIALGNLFDLMKGRILIGQNPSLDLAFLLAAGKTIGGNIPHLWAIDISKLFVRVYPDQRNLSLDSMANRLHLDERGQYHNALEDAILTTKILARLVPQLQRINIRTIDKFISVGKVRMSKF